MNILKKQPLAIGTLIPLLLFFLVYSVAHLNDDNTKRYALPESNPSIQAEPTSGTKMPRDSFIRFEQVFVDSITHKETIMGYGSGVVFQTTANGSYILTNHHVCHIDLSDVFEMAARGQVGSMKNMVKSLGGERSQVKILKKDSKKDMCVVFADNFFLPAVKLAPQIPSIGETVYVVGAPRGYYVPKYSAVPIFQGIFNGYDTHWADKHTITAMFSVRIAPGNSGSAIFNRKGQLIGVVHSHLTIFDEITWGTTYVDTKDFIKPYIYLK